MERLFSESCSEIEVAYSRLGHQLGWRFLASPRSTLSGDTEIALITMNPGGSVIRPDHARESSEAGSAYIVEAWKHGYRHGEAPLQVQVRRLFDLLAAAKGHRSSGDDLLHSSLAAYFVPFRSPTFKMLSQSRDSLLFASQLWTRLFRYIDPKLVITIDQGTTQRLTRILCAKLGTPPSRQEFPIGWDSYTAELVSFKSDDIQRAIVRFPHLSRFGIFGRAQSQPHVERIIDAIASSLLLESPLPNNRLQPTAADAILSCRG